MPAGTFTIHDEDSPHSLLVTRQGDMLYIHTNDRTIAFDEHMAQHLYLALAAIQTRQYDRAATLTYTSIELERNCRRAASLPPPPRAATMEDLA